MLRRMISIALVALGLIVAALAVASATVWRAPETVTASLGADPEAPLVVTDPGVLGLLDEDVQVRAVAEGGMPVVLAVGRAEDVTAWVGESAHVRVSGLSSWDELETGAVEGEGEAPPPAGSDLWLAEATGEGEATLEWTAGEGRHSLLAATDGASPAPGLELTWERRVTTPLLVPGLVVGGLLVVLGSVLAYLTSRRPTGAGVRSGTRQDAVRVDGEGGDAAPGRPQTREDRS